MIKRQKPYLSEKELSGKRTVRVSPKINLLNPRPSTKYHGLFKSKQSSPRKHSNINNDLKFPRTCAESPLALTSAAKNPGPEKPNSQHKPLGIRITEIIRVSHAKSHSKARRNSLMPQPLNMLDLLVSPIQKIHMTFLNNEDNSLITTLETLSHHIPNP